MLGSGLGQVADAVEGATVIPYSDLPGFPQPSVEGHAGRAVAGSIDGVPVVAFQGARTSTRASTWTSSASRCAR